MSTVTLPALSPDPAVESAAHLALRGARESEEARSAWRRKGDALRLISPSGLGGCERATVYDLLGWEPVNHVTEFYEAWKGTAVHEKIEKGLHYLVKTYPELATDLHIEARVDGIPDLRLRGGSCDLYRTSTRTVTDWKSSLAAKMNSTRFPWPGTHRLWQVMTYAKLLREAGNPVDFVEIVGIPLDGGPRDTVRNRPFGWRTWRYAYDETVFEEAMGWLSDQVNIANYIEDTGDIGALPAPTRPAAIFCKPYCPFYSPEEMCPGGN